MIPGEPAAASPPLLGEGFALAAAICWSIAVILFRKTGERVPALALNIFKNCVAILLFAATLAAMGDSLFRSVPVRVYILLLVSGAIGIGIADTLFFLTLNRVGASLQAIITTSYAPSIILLGILFLGERLSALQAFGAALIVGAVASVAWVRGRGETIPRSALLGGIVFGVLATSTQAVSIVMIKRLLNESPLIWANVWRLAGGLAMSLLLLPLLPARRRAFGSLRESRIWKVMLPGAVVGTYISLMFWLGGMKYAQVSVASAINQTSTLWTFALAALALKEPVTRRRVVALATGAAGIALVSLG